MMEKNMDKTRFINPYVFPKKNLQNKKQHSCKRTMVGVYVERKVNEIV
jgi:hypothetical protein